MKKQFIILFTVVVLILQISGVSASGSITANYTFNRQDNSYVVSGTVSGTDKARDQITIVAKVDTDIVDVCITETVRNADSSIGYESRPFIISEFIDSGELTFEVYSAQENYSAVTAAVTHVGMDIIFPNLKNVAEKINTDNYNGMLGLLNDINMTLNISNAAVLGVDITSIGTLTSQTSEEAMKGYIKAQSLTVPSEIETDEQVMSAYSALKRFRKMINIMRLLGEFAVVNSSEKYAIWYQNNKAIVQEGFNETEQKYFASMPDYSILSMKSTSFSDFNALKERMIEVAALTVVKNSNAASVEDVFSDFADRISLQTSLNITQKSLVFASLAGNSYASFDDLKAKFNEYANRIDSGIVTDKVTGGSGGGGGGSSVGGGNIAITPFQEIEKKQPFSDLEGHSWAMEAVNKLYDAGIVNGKEDGVFAPQDIVTRAEFIKMLVCVMGGKTEKWENTFTDIKESDWYSGYVIAAHRMGLVNGYQDNTFKPNAPIDRQDMAVMIFRCLNVGEENYDLPFSDADLISDYAKNAVSFLYNYHVINGMGDGRFAPFERATRAEAAQMLFNYMNIKR